MSDQAIILKKHRRYRFSGDRAQQVLKLFAEFGILEALAQNSATARLFGGGSPSLTVRTYQHTASIKVTWSFEIGAAATALRVELKGLSLP